MTTYSVKYKKNNSLFWKTLKKVKGDGFLSDTIKTLNGVQIFQTFNVRYFIMEDEERIEIPTTNYTFRFCKKRYELIKERMEIESGGKLTEIKR